MSEGPEPDIFIRILNKVDQIDGMAADLREIKHVQSEHTVILTEHSRKLAEHDRRFDRIDQTLAEHTLRLDQLDVAVIDLHHDLGQHSHTLPNLRVE